MRIKSFLMGLMGLLTIEQVSLAQSKLNRPNILFIPVDDLRPELGCYGNTIIKTPNIDKIAARGVTFMRAYCQQAVCNPSRASLMTGLRPDSLRVWDLNTDFRTNVPSVVTLPQHFKNNGYTTVNLGKAFHNIFPDSLSWTEELHVNGFPFDPDAVYAGEENRKIIEKKKQKMIDEGKSRIDQYGLWYIKANATENVEVDDDAYYDGAQTTLAIKALQKLKPGNKPFFLSVGYYRPHLPFNAPKKYWDLYDRALLPLAKNEFIPKGSPAYSVHGDQELRNYEDYKDLPLPNEKPLDEWRQRELVHGYYASISYIDAQIGRLLDELERSGQLQNTIIVLWGDHGWKLGEHNSWCKQSNFEIDTRVPMIVGGNGVKATGQKSNALTEFVDIFPTLCDLAGLDIPQQCQGTSFLPLLNNPKQAWKKAAFSQFLLGRFPVKQVNGIERMGYTMRTDRYRYVEWYNWVEDKRTTLIGQELFDHTTDPEENTNLAGDQKNKKVINQLAEQLHKGWRYARPGFTLK